MKDLLRVLVPFMIVVVSLSACGQNKNKESKIEEPIMKKEATLEMNRDSLYNNVATQIEDNILERKSGLSEDAIAVLLETQNLLNNIEDGKKEDLIKKGKELIGNLEVLFAKDPSLVLIPVDVNYKREEFVADIETVRENVELAKIAMDKGEYRVASDILKDLRSEMVINTYFIPTATYPDAIKAAIVFLEDDKKDLAVKTLESVLSSLVIQETIIPLPVLNAEEMIKEASKIDEKNHDNVDKVLNLLKNADYQLQLAEEMGYGKKDKEFGGLSLAIESLKKAVDEKQDSKSKFDSLKKQIKGFKERLFTK